MGAAGVNLSKRQALLLSLGFHLPPLHVTPGPEVQLRTAGPPRHQSSPKLCSKKSPVKAEIQAQPCFVQGIFCKDGMAVTFCLFSFHAWFSV